MRKSTQRYIEKNDREYGHYIRNIGKLHSAIFSSLFLLVISGLVLYIRNIFLRKKALKLAGGTVIENKEVLEWVKEQVAAQQIDMVFGLIVGITLIMIGLVWITHFAIKSYDLYKMSWLRVIPTMLASVLLLVLLFQYKFEYLELSAATLIELFPLITASNIFLPLQIREYYVDYIKCFFAMGNWIINKL